MSALDIMVHLGRLKDGERRVLSIMRIGGLQNGEVELEPLFEYDGKEDRLCQKGKDTGGTWLGRKLPGGKPEKEGSQGQASRPGGLQYPDLLPESGCYTRSSGVGSLWAGILCLLPQCGGVPDSDACWSPVIPLYRRSNLKKERARRLELQFKGGNPGSVPPS